MAELVSQPGIGERYTSMRVLSDQVLPELTQHLSERDEIADHGLSI